jgi:hypothetical protein
VCTKGYRLGDPLAGRGAAASSPARVNGAAFNPLAPFGGFKRSGLGREAGPFGIEEFLTVKSLQLLPGPLIATTMGPCAGGSH